MVTSVALASRSSRLASALALACLLQAGLAAAADEQKGLASWYGAQFHGRPTASGEPFDKEAMTAAHRTLPFGTLIEVKNLDNGQSAVLRVNDRGPFVHGRILDCSEGGARSLGFIQAGVARVKIVTLGRIPDASEPMTKKERKRLQKALATSQRTHREDAFPRDVLKPVDAEAGPFAVQVGSFKDPANAARLAKALQDKGWRAFTVPAPEGFTRVRVGPYSTRAAAEEAAPKMGVESEPFIVRAD